MFIDIDYNKKMKDYKIELSKPNKTIITNLSERINAKLSTTLGNIGELTFQIPYKIEDDNHVIIDNPNINLLKERMYLRLTIGNQKMWFLVDNISDEADDMDWMTVQAFSLPYELKNKKVDGMILQSINAEMLMEELLVSSSWKKGTVDAALQGTYRSFDFDNTTIYDSLVDGAETFGAVIVWEEETKTVNFKELSNIGQYRGMSVNADKFLKSLKRDRTTEEMVTRLYVYGNERMSIQNVNPSGLKYLEDFSYFLEPFSRDVNKNIITHSHYMSDELCHAILDNKQLKEQALPQINSLQSQISVLNNSLSVRELEISEVKLSLATTKGLLDIAKSVGNTALITQRQSEVTALESSIVSKQAVIDNTISQINTKTTQMVNLQNSISITSFTPQLLEELDVYIIEKDFSDDRYIDETSLYNAGIEKFAEMRSPKIVVEISIENLLSVIEEQYYWDKIVIGDEIHVKYPNMKVDYKSTIVGLDFDLDYMECIVKIANHTDDLDAMDKLVSIIYNNQSTSLTITNNKYKWDSIIDVKNRVDELRDGEIDAVKNRITAGVNESVNIGDNGIVLTNPNFPEEMVIMQAGVIALTKDGGDTWNTSITPNGVIAETIIGNLIAGNELVITNASGTFVMDASGLTIDSDSIFINSGDSQTPENLLDTWNSMSLTMSEFSNDSLINKYEKQQLKKQWDNIVSIHNSMLNKFHSELGAETTENPYPIEYDVYIAKYTALNTYLNSTLQADGFAILNATNMDNTTTIIPLTYNTKFSEYSKAKDDFQVVIPLEYTKASIEVLQSGINLNYVKNSDVVAKINLSEEGVRIDGKMLYIDTDTHFNHDLVMDAGLIRSADGAINIDLNQGTINLSRPLTINYVEVATTQQLNDIELTAGPKGDKGDEGISSFLWVRYAQDDAGTGFTTSPVNALYIGFAKTTVNVEPTVYTSYKWSLIKGTQGFKGDEGDSSYIHIKYSNDGGTTLTGNNGEDSGTYIGTYTDFVELDSLDVSKYKWSKIRGDDGDDALLLFLSTDRENMSFDFNGTANPVSQTATFTAKLQNLTGNATFTATAYNGDSALTDVIVLGGTGNTRTFSVANFPATATRVSVTATIGTLSDIVSVHRIKHGATGGKGDTGGAGENAIVGYLTNESATLGANLVGDVSSYATAIGNFKVFDGLTDVSGSANFSKVSETGITGSIDINGAYSAITMTADSASVKFRATYNGVTIDKIFTISRSKTGATGGKGDTGESAVSFILSNENQSVLTGSDRKASAAQTIKIPFTAYYGLSKVACTASLGALPSGVTVASNTAGTGSTDGEIILSVASQATLGGTTAAYDSGNIEITLSANAKTLKKIFGWSKAIAGTTARTYMVEPSVATIIKSVSGTYVPSSLTFYSYYKDGTSDAKTLSAKYWKIETTTNGTSWTQYAVKTDVSASSYTVAIIPAGISGIRATIYTDNTLTTGQDTQSVMVVSDGVQGIQGNPAFKLSWAKTNVSENAQGELYKSAGVSGNWDAGAYSVEGFTSGALLTFVLEDYDINDRLMVGLNTDPVTDDSYLSIDYAFYIDSYQLQIYESGTLMSTFAGLSQGDTFSIAYDNANIRYYRNGELLRTKPVASGLKLHVDRAFKAVTTKPSIKGLYFAPTGSVGANGQSTYTWIRYADTATGTGMSNSPIDKRYFGIANNQTSSTESTDPALYTWSPLYDNVSVGAENIVLKSDIAISTANYMTNRYDLTEKMIAGEKYALRLWGALGAGKTHFEAYLNGSLISLAALTDNLDGTYSIVFNGKDSGVTTGDSIHIYAKSSATIVDSTIDKIKLERGTIYTGYSIATKDISELINQKADADSVNTLVQNYAEVRALAESKMSSADYKEFIDSYETFMASYEVEKTQAEADKSSLVGRATALEENLGGMSRKWNFVDSSIQMAEEGMLISGVIYDETRNTNDPTGMEILLTNNQISFLDNGTVVAFISGKVLQINHGIFVKSLQVGSHLMHSLESNPKITIFSYVGEE